MGVAVWRYIDILIIIITFPYSTCISSFFGSSIRISLFIFLNVFRSCLLFFVQTLLKEHLKSFKNQVNANIINYIDNYECRPHARARESRDFHVRGTA